MLNPKTAAKQWLRLQEQRTQKNAKIKFQSSPNDPLFQFDKWGTGGKVIRSMQKQQSKIDAYIKKITHFKTVVVGGQNVQVRHFIDTPINTNKFTNGSLQPQN